MNEIEYNKLIDELFVEMEVIQLEKLSEIGNKVSNIAHEIRSQLNIISTAAYLLKKTLQENNTEEAGYNGNMELYLSQIKDSIRRAENIITNILNFARPSKKEFEILDIASIIEQVLVFVSMDFNYKNVKVIKNISDVSAIEGNLNVIRQIFLNLIKYSIQSMPNGGELTIETSRQNAVSNSKLEYDGILIKISDSGIGMSKDCRKNIFKPFFSAKECRIGFGLYTVKKGVELHRGKIDVVSEEGKGTAFIIELPIRHGIQKSESDIVDA